MKVKAINNLDVNVLLDEVLAWNPSEIIAWQGAFGLHTSTKSFNDAYYKKILERSEPSLKFYANYNELRGTCHWRPAIMLDPSSRLLQSASTHVYAPERGLFATIALGCSQYEHLHETENELLLFAVADDVQVVWPADTDSWLKRNKS